MNSIQSEPANEQALFNNDLRDKDRQMLQDVTHRLLAHGSLLRARATERPLYDWSIEHQPWLEDWAGLLGLKIIIQRDERLIMAIPEVPSLTRKLKRDETLVALALWYDFDVEVRENGAHDVYFNLREFNELFQSKFPSMQPLSQSRMKEILRLFSRFNLIEMEWEAELTDSTIQILPTLRFAIPFPGIEQWVKAASAFKEDPTKEDLETEQSLDSAETESDETPTSVEAEVSGESSDEPEEKGLLDDEEEEA